MIAPVRNTGTPKIQCFGATNLLRKKYTYISSKMAIDTENNLKTDAHLQVIYLLV